MHSEAIISHNLSLTAYRAYTTYTPILALEGCLLEHLLEDGARSGVPRCAAGNRSPREAPDPALRALGPGCEELAVTDPDASPVREARPRAQNRHGGAPRGERPSPRDARRLTSAWRVRTRPTGASHERPYVSRCSAHPSLRVREAKSKPRAQKVRR